MNQLDRRERQYPVAHPDITRKLKECAGAILSNALTIEHVPGSARAIMENSLIHDFIHNAFRDVVVDCLAAYFERLEESRREVLEAIVYKTQSKYGMRVRLVRSAVERMTYKSKYEDLVEELEERVNPEMYREFVGLVRKAYGGQ